MSSIILDQFNKVRGWTIKIAENLSEEIVNIQPEGFNNTIKWHIGHVITETEYFMFELSNERSNIPEQYNDYFAPGTKPSNWKGQAPSLSELITELKNQQRRVNEIQAETFNRALDQPVHGFTTTLDAASFSAIHESLHLGQIEAMQRIRMVSAK
ncbi:DinB family protein [Pseudalkalibacillus berkeleyi]|uniref:DinB family protein n=1 Tax=Pseudalkalibacillus berkeleyi TaxID=1069813 RepID=A0ABS9GUK0_9BACL|nr:DinB family protein [Pseudalkalibacillus berkeleyi]MCF6136519.1 DinB family protein [Pseudalkalibacillus berkeleyi]